jgi:Flp pilus assembly protein TadB
MSSSDRGPLEAAKAFAWSVFLVALLLFGAVWLVQQVWAWLIVLLALVLLVGGVVWWLRARRDRW